MTSCLERESHIQWMRQWIHWMPMYCSSRILTSCIVLLVLYTTVLLECRSTISQNLEDCHWPQRLRSKSSTFEVDISLGYRRTDKLYPTFSSPSSLQGKWDARDSTSLLGQQRHHHPQKCPTLLSPCSLDHFVKTYKYLNTANSSTIYQLQPQRIVDMTSRSYI
jgi:hypothetical protein